MTRLKRFSIILFILSAALFAFFLLRTIQTSDSTPPKITMDSDKITISVKDGEDKLLEGVTAEDNRDGDVTGSIVVENLSNFLEDGTRIVSYCAFDEAENISKAQRLVTYSDYQSPRFEISDPLKFAANSNNFAEYITASDVLDGDITRNIQMNAGDNFDAQVPGEYTMTYSVTNSAGDTSVLPVTIEITDSSAGSKPEIELTQYILYLNKGDNAPDYTSFLKSAYVNGYQTDFTEEAESSSLSAGAGNMGVSKSDIDISGEVDYNAGGVYEVTYSATNEDGVTGKTRLVVVVDDGAITVGGNANNEQIKTEDDETDGTASGSVSGVVEASSVSTTAEDAGNASSGTENKEGEGE